MTALVTCAHAGALIWPFRKSGSVLKDVYLRRRVRAEECGESLDALVAHRCLFASICVIECVAYSVPRYIRRRKDILTSVSRNSLICENKGVQEFVNIGNFLKRSAISDDETIVKLTARYLIQRPDFLLYAAGSTSAAVVRKDSDVWGERGRGVHTFLFAARKHVLTSFSGWLLDGQRYKQIGATPIEWVFGDYLKVSGHDITYYPARLHVLARYSPPLTHLTV